jgi:hypothetical protein
MPFTLSRTVQHPASSSLPLSTLRIFTRLANKPQPLSGDNTRERLESVDWIHSVIILPSVTLSALQPPMQRTVIPVSRENGFNRVSSAGFSSKKQTGYTSFSALHFLQPPMQRTVIRVSGVNGFNGSNRVSSAGR